MLDRRLQIAEYLFIAGSVVGWIISVASGQLIYAAVPVSVALLLGSLNRLHIEQRMRRRLNNAIAQLHRQLSEENHSRYEQLQAAIASLQAELPRYFPQTEFSDPQSSISEATAKDLALRRLRKHGALAKRHEVQQHSADRNMTELKAQLASFEQSLNSVVQYLNTSSLLARVEQLEKLIASPGTEPTQIQQQRSDGWIDSYSSGSYGFSSHIGNYQRQSDPN